MMLDRRSSVHRLHVVCVDLHCSYIGLVAGVYMLTTLKLSLPVGPLRVEGAPVQTCRRARCRGATLSLAS